MTTGKTTALTIRTFVGKVMSLLFNMLSRSFPSKEQACFNFMAAVSIHSAFGGQENKIRHCIHLLHWPPPNQVLAIDISLKKMILRFHHYDVCYRILEDIFHHAEDISYVGITDFHLSIDFKFYWFFASIDICGFISFNVSIW